MIPQDILHQIDEHRSRYVEQLFGFLRIPSISTYPRHAHDIRIAAEWVLDHLDLLGFEANLIETGGPPLVFAKRCPHPAKPTLLIYGHYDVQPAEPLAEWITPPFEPELREGFLYARGASDDKGQFFTYLKAIEAILKIAGELPINVKVLVEGEEEIGSPQLAPVLDRYRNELAADAVAISDGSQFDHQTPAITYGLRGLAYLQLDIEGPRFDLHSGSLGGLVANPVQVLADLLARLKKPDGAVAIPGFYDEVLELDPWERQEMASLPFNEAALKEYLGVSELVGEPTHTPMERKTARPTLDVNGIWGGFSGEGAKTIIPARAGAKVSMRLVPNQSSAKVNALFKSYVHSLVPSGVKIIIQELTGSDPVLVSRNQRTVQAATRAIQIGFGKAPVFIREGGSIPVVTLFKKVLGLDSLLLGWGRPDDGAHSPNERFCLEDFHRGVRTAAALLYELAS